MNTALVKKLELAKQDKRTLNALILEYIPFIKKNIAVFFYNREGRQDALTDAMLAFVHAVQTYNPENGSFIAYATTVMRNRLINFAKKEHRERKRFIFFSAKDDETVSDWENNISQQLYDFEEEQRNLDIELNEVDTVFSHWGFDWDRLATKCPKQKRSRNACFAIARQIIGNISVFETMMKTFQLPINDLVSREVGSKKTLEKYRQFIVAIVILIKGDYPYIRAFLPQFFDDGYMGEGAFL
jgi:RNA polymerase sigma factor